MSCGKVLLALYMPYLWLFSVLYRGHHDVGTAHIEGGTLTGGGAQHIGQTGHGPRPEGVEGCDPGVRPAQEKDNDTVEQRPT